MSVIPKHPYNAPYHPKFTDTLKFFIWFNSYFKEENKTAPMHFQMIDHINRKRKKKVVECTRGASKSTLVGVYYLLYCIWKGYKYNHGDVNVIVYIMDSVQKAASQISRILYTIEDNPELKKVLKVTRSTMGNDPTIEFYHTERKQRIKLVGRGSGQSVRGINFMNKRPDWIIFDDIESEESAGTKDNRDKLKAWFFGNVIPAGIPGITEYTFIGTPLHADSLLMNLVESEGWEAIQLPIAENFPVQKDEKIISCWPDRFTEEFIKESYQDYKDLGKTALWNQEHMLIIAPKESLLYNIDQIKRYKSTDMLKNFSKLTYYISLDLAVSEKTTADYTAISVIGVNSNNHWFLVDGMYGRMKPDDTIDKLFNFVVKYRPYSVIFEKVAFQMAMKTFIQNEMVNRGIFFNLNMVARTTQKLSVLKSFQPVVELGRFWIPEDILKDFTSELLDEMAMITEDKILAVHDDLIDSIAQLTLIEMIAATPIEETRGLDIMEPEVNSYIF